MTDTRMNILFDEYHGEAVSLDEHPGAPLATALKERLSAESFTLMAVKEPLSPDVLKHAQIFAILSPGHFISSR